MQTKTEISCGVALVAITVAMALIPMVGHASTPSSPAERAATAALNRQIATDNAAADAQHSAQEAQYREMLREYQARQQQYEAQLRSQGR